MYRQMITNDDGEPLGYDYTYDDEPEPLDDVDDYGYDEEEEDFDTYPDTDLDQEYLTDYEEYEPNPYDGTYSEE